VSLTAGTRLGPYEILAPLGTGGMGEVYRARDTRLDRTVAIKILPSQFSADPVRRVSHLSRLAFERCGVTVNFMLDVDRFCKRWHQTPAQAERFRS
jgi:serine/threonine protein kinase